MSEPIAIQAPQPSGTGSSRIGTAGFAIGIAIVALVVAAAVIGNALVPQDPFTQDLGNRLKPPFWMEGSQAGHLLGTDQLGRDYLARLVYGARISLLIGIMTVITSGLIGITLGVLVFQDIWAILFLAIQPDLRDPAPIVLLISLAKGAAVVAFALAASRYVLPRLFRSIAKLPELMVLGALAWCFLVAETAYRLSLSRALRTAKTISALSSLKWPIIFAITEMSSCRSASSEMVASALPIWLSSPASSAF